MKIKRIHVMFLVLMLAVLVIPFRAQLHQFFSGAIQTVTGKKTIADRVAEYGDIVQERLTADFARVGVAYPPKAMTLVGLKQEKTLEVWVSGDGANMRLLRNYPILAASGKLGPKLKEGDRQVPEGLYRIESLNPNSLFHLALRVGYPNEFDRAHGKADGRDQLGGDIMIHGSSASIGCLAMGDEAAEDLFVLATETGIENISVILSPLDFRVRALPADMPLPPWTTELYDAIRHEMARLKNGLPVGKTP